MKFSKYLLFNSICASALFASSLSFACGIVGYLGEESTGGKACLLEGLSRLEYRGYDSAGISCVDNADGKIKLFRAVGKLKNLREKMDQYSGDGCIGIGHNRWATHGEPTENNAHPHQDSSGKIAVVHNGVIENYSDLRKELQAGGVVFKSETDTEVIPHLLSSYLKMHNSNLELAMQDTVNKIHGSFAFLGIVEGLNDTMVAAVKESPMNIGVGKDKLVVASDVMALAGHVDRVIRVPEKTFAILKRNSIQLFTFDGKPADYKIENLDITPEAIDKAGFDHFMAKEIREQPARIKTVVEEYDRIGETLWDQAGTSADAIRKLKAVYLTGCGTSKNASDVGAVFFEEIAGIEATTKLSSELMFRKFQPRKKSLAIAVSQSGTTADVKAVFAEHQIPFITLTNVMGSDLTRYGKCTGAWPVCAGPEISVASTKAFTGQIASMYWIANMIKYEKMRANPKTREAAQQVLSDAKKALLDAAYKLDLTMNKYAKELKETVVDKYADHRTVTFLGRHITEPFAQEASLKFKELIYTPSQAYGTGELKHGPLATIEKGSPVFIFSHQRKDIYLSILSNAQEVKARGGRLIVFAFEGQKELMDLAEHSFEIPRVAPLLEPLVMAGLMQSIAYESAVKLGRDVDKPRNLAKSVTVK